MNQFSCSGGVCSVVGRWNGLFCHHCRARLRVHACVRVSGRRCVTCALEKPIENSVMGLTVFLWPPFRERLQWLFSSACSRVPVCPVCMIFHFRDYLAISVACCLMTDNMLRTPAERFSLSDMNCISEGAADARWSSSVFCAAAKTAALSSMRKADNGGNSLQGPCS